MKKRNKKFKIKKAQEKSHLTRPKTEFKRRFLGFCEAFESRERIAAVKSKSNCTILLLCNLSFFGL